MARAKQNHAVQRSIMLCCAFVATVVSGADWRAIGPYGGEVRSIAVDESSSTMYVVNSRRGLFTRKDALAPWRIVFDGARNHVDSSSVAVNGSTVLLATTGGLFRSTDGGEQWGLITEGLAPQTITALDAVPDFALAAVGPQLFRSADDGAHWVGVDAPLTENSAEVIHVARVEPHSPSAMYISIGSRFYRGDDRGTRWMLLPVTNIVSVAFGSNGTMYAAGSRGVFRSTDRGNTWQQRSTIEAVALLISGDTLFAATAAGVYRIDPGEPALVSDRLPTTPVLTLAAASAQTIYAGTPAGLFMTSDGGQTWSDSSRGLTNTRIAAQVVSSSALYAATKGQGVMKTVDAGAHWISASAGLPEHPPASALVSTLAADPTTSMIYAGFFLYPDGVYRSNDGGTSWSPAANGLPALRVQALAVDPGVGGTVYAGTSGGGIAKTQDAGASWTKLSRYTDSEAVSIAVDPVDGRFTYATSGSQLWKTSNGGESWSTVGGLAAANIVAVDAGSNVFVVTAIGNLLKSTDRGVSWSAATRGLPGGDAAVVREIFATAKQLYVVVDPVPGSDTAAIPLFLSEDGGQSWRAVDRAEQLPPDITSVVEDKDALFVGTDSSGVFTNAAPPPLRRRIVRH